MSPLATWCFTHVRTVKDPSAVGRGADRIAADQPRMLRNMLNDRARLENDEPSLAPVGGPPRN
jgi:hypothetical protein